MNNDIKHILRVLKSKMLYSVVIILSLTVALVCANILITFLIYEYNTDSFHTKNSRIFQVMSEDPFGKKDKIPSIPENFLKYVISNYPEVEDISQIVGVDYASLEIDNAYISNLKVLYTDDSFFNVFDFPIVEGSKRNNLEPGELILTEEKANTIFNSSKVVNEQLRLHLADSVYNTQVSSVIKTGLGNSHIIFDVLIPKSYLSNKIGISYLLLKEGVNAKSLIKKINESQEAPSLLGFGKLNYSLIPLNESYFSTTNTIGYLKVRNPEFLKLGVVVCLLVLIIASFNFANLYLIYLQERRREFGIKKTLGINFTRLLKTSIIEVGIYLLISFFLSVIITALSIPMFNDIFQSNLSPNFFTNFKVLTSIVALLTILGGIIVFLSISEQKKVKPINLISKISTKMKYKKVLFTSQFIISTTLIICSLTIIKQINYIKDAPIGFNRNIIQLNIPDDDSAKKLPVLKSQILEMPNIQNASVGSSNPISWITKVRYDLENGEYYTPYLLGGDSDYFKTLGLELIEGDFPSSRKNGKLINQRFVAHFEMEEPIGKKIPGTQDIIIGVVKDFTCDSFKSEIPPVILSYYENGQSLLIDYSKRGLNGLVAQLQQKWLKLFPNAPFNYDIISDDLIKKYEEEIFFSRIVIAFSIISIVLSCFGLFALSTAIIEKRRKELGIRKILGASTKEILNLLTITFTKRIVIAYLIAMPLAYYLMNLWLSRFTNKISLSVGIFFLSGLLVFIIYFITLSYQCIRAASTNPVNELKIEL